MASSSEMKPRSDDPKNTDQAKEVKEYSNNDKGENWTFGEKAGINEKDTNK